MLSLRHALRLLTTHRCALQAVVEEPLVILVKLADRLHNMRTVYALPPAKQQAVAEETLAVWCSMAASLGWHSLKVCSTLCHSHVAPLL
jgi:(p)ppGpp synthase/HD superfamily hydrolase